MTANCKQRKTSNFGRHESSTSCMYIVIISLSLSLSLSWSLAVDRDWFLSPSLVITRFLPQLLSLLLSLFLPSFDFGLSVSLFQFSSFFASFQSLIPSVLSFSSITDVGWTQSVDSKGSPPPPLLLLPLLFLPLHSASSLEKERK